MTGAQLPGLNQPSNAEMRIAGTIATSSNGDAIAVTLRKDSWNRLSAGSKPFIQPPSGRFNYSNVL